MALGSAVGGVSRYLLSAAVQARVPTAFPLGTLLVNISGSLLLGFVMRYALGTGSVSPELRALMRIHVGERDRDPATGRSLYEAIVELLRARHYAGATVMRAIMGFGATARLRSDSIEVLSLDLPIVIECVETAERIDAILPELDAMIGGGLITLERARVIMYRPEARVGRT